MDCWWVCWSSALKAGVILGSALVALIISLILYCCLRCYLRLENHRADLEQSHSGTAHERGTSRRKRARDSSVDQELASVHGKKELRSHKRSGGSSSSHRSPLPLSGIPPRQSSLRRSPSISPKMGISETSSGCSTRAVGGVRRWEDQSGLRSIRRASRYRYYDQQKKSHISRKRSSNYLIRPRRAPSPRKRSRSPGIADRSSRRSPLISAGLDVSGHIVDLKNQGEGPQAKNSEHRSRSYSQVNQARYKVSYRKRSPLKLHGRALYEAMMSGARNESPDKQPALVPSKSSSRLGESDNFT